MEDLKRYRQRVLYALGEGVAELSKTMDGIPPNAWQISPGQNTHTPHAVLSHLFGLERLVFHPLLRRIIEEDQPLLPLFDDTTWIGTSYKPEKPAQVILDQFSRLRTREIRWLSSLPPPAWSRTARHPCWGVRTFQWWVELQLEYSKTHLAELATFLPIYP